MNIKTRSLMEIHLAVLFFGLSGLFAKFLNLAPVIIVFGRVLFSSMFLLPAAICTGNSIKLNRIKDYISLMLMGILLTVHWISFFQSIQMSTVAIGLLTFSTFPVFTTFMEPFFLEEKIRLRNIQLSLMSLMGIWLAMPSIDFKSNLTWGFIWGLFSGFTYAILSLLNKKYAGKYSGIAVSFYEQFSSTILLLPFFLVKRPLLTSKDILLLVFLGVVFTGMPHSLFIGSLKSIKASTAGIISNLEPVYGIIFAIFFLGEIPALREIIGIMIVLGTAFYSTCSSVEH